MRKRAVFTGTVGGRMARTNKPCVSNCLLNHKVCLFSPMIIVWIAVIESSSSKVVTDKALRKY